MTEQKVSKFKEGQELDFIRVRFPGNSSSFAFLIGNRKYSYGQKVVAMSDRGIDVGYINSFPYKLKFKEDMLPIETIKKIATEEDIKKQKELVDKQKNAQTVCIDLINKLKLEMTITHVEIVQFGKKVVFYFVAPNKVDFRQLVKGLASSLRMKIELRQISVRERTAALGSIGTCGLMTCCSSFLKNYGTVNIKMAKNQNLSLMPSKLNGVCGQTKCCVKYEDEVYTNKRRLLPKEGNFIKTKNGDCGKVLRLHLLSEQFEMLTDKGEINRYSKKLYDKNIKLAANWNFPENFEHIVNKTSQLISN